MILWAFPNISNPPVHHFYANPIWIPEILSLLEIPKDSMLKGFGPKAMVFHTCIGEEGHNLPLIKAHPKLNATQYTVLVCSSCQFLYTLSPSIPVFLFDHGIGCVSWELQDSPRYFSLELRALPVC